MALLKVIEWSDNSHNTLVYKIDTKKNVIARGSALTVREGQAAVFCDKGRMADVFLPGYYKLDTDSLPVLTALLSWKYGFETPFKSEVYFVNTNRFTKQRWGTANPIMLRDPDFGAVRVRGYGTYSFRVKDPYVFMTELSGSHSTYRTEDISDHIRSMLVMAISDALGESGISVVDMAANLMELSDAVKASLEKRFSELGLELSDFNFENVSLPAELEKAMDENARLGMFRRNMDVYTR
ncbi:MAG: SPFH domain-containing protein, partial [Christensenellaceae bacterium]